jgi:hypothetical protein
MVPLSQNLLETVAAVVFAHPKYGPNILFLLFAIVPIFDALANLVAARTTVVWDDALIGTLVRDPLSARHTTISTMAHKRLSRAPYQHRTLT